MNIREILKIRISEYKLGTERVSKKMFERITLGHPTPMFHFEYNI